jgi:hypothetical protein
MQTTDKNFVAKESNAGAVYASKSKRKVRLELEGEWAHGDWWLGEHAGSYMRDKVTKDLLLCDYDWNVLYTVRDKHYKADVARLIEQGL